MDESNVFCSEIFTSISQDVTITQLDCLPTQELFSVAEVKNDRFENVKPSSTDDLERRKLERLPKSTRKQNCWAMGAYEDWAIWRNNQAETLLGDSGAVPKDLRNQSLECINFWLSRFIVECRRKDGTYYPPNTLYNITASIQRTLRDHYGRNEIKILDSSDISFADFRKLLDARMKELTNKGIGIYRQRADPVTEADEEQLWDSGVIGLSSAKSLSYGVFFYNCKLFGFRGGDEHMDLQTDQYRITEKNGEKVLTFYGRTSKNVQGGLKQRRVEPKVINQHADQENNRCVVRLFETYLKNIPKGDFYLRPLPSKFNRPIFFFVQKVGVNCLSKYMKTMFLEAGIDIENRNIRNHSGKVTLCTRLYDQNFDEQAIMARSGHRSVAVRDYKRPSEELQRDVSVALQPRSKIRAVSTPPPPSEAIVPLFPTPPTPQPKLESNVQTDIEPTRPGAVDAGCIEIVLPSSIHTVILVKNGRKSSIAV